MGNSIIIHIISIGYPFLIMCFLSLYQVAPKVHQDLLCAVSLVVIPSNP